jgi:hypothetical protein
MANTNRHNGISLAGRVGTVDADGTAFTSS